MKHLQKSDLKEGEIYTEPNNGNICMWNKTDSKYFIGNRKSNFKKGEGGFGAINNYRLREATPEEKHWLETCIKADQFVSYEEAMKTFVKYYKIIVSKIAMNYNNNVIHKDSIVFGHYQGNNRIIKTIETGKHRIDSTIDVLYGKIGEQKVCFDMTALQPSTKEAYDAQFVVKEPEFVLPEKWYIKLTFENQKTVIDYINKNSNDGERSGNIGMYYGYNGVHCTSIFNTLSNTEITFDQFKQYVLKENTKVTEKSKIVLEKPKDKVLLCSSKSYLNAPFNIIKVQCSEGGVYRVGDKITVFTKNSPNKGKPFTIIGFRWNNAKTEICAITNGHQNVGIRLSKIELYVEPKVKVKDDFVLPKKWCVEVNEELRNRFGYYKAYGYHHSIQINDTNKWSINIKEGFTEITFEQFKKYVLKDE